MKTGSHRTYWGAGRISISRSTRGCPEGYRCYPDLAPGPWFNSVPKDEYERLFGAQLAQLDAHKVWEDLHRLAAGGAEPVLMCFEVPPFTETNWCHRRLVAAWFERALGARVDELTPAELGTQPPRPTPTPRPARPTSTPHPAQSVPTSQLSLDLSSAPAAPIAPVSPSATAFLLALSGLRGNGRSFRVERYKNAPALRGMLGAAAVQRGHARLVKHRDHTESYRITPHGCDALKKWSEA